jgi:hypothetical protein
MGRIREAEETLQLLIDYSTRFRRMSEKPARLKQSAARQSPKR